MTILYGTKLNGDSRPIGRRAGIALRKITQDVRDYAKERGIGIEIVVEEGMRHKAEEFKSQGSEIYKKA